MKTEKTPERLWYTAKLTPLAIGLFTDGFYPEPKRGSGDMRVYFTQVDCTPTSKKVIVASKMAEAGLRMLTQELAIRCLEPGQKATRAEMKTLNELTKNIKV